MNPVRSSFLCFSKVHLLCNLRIVVSPKNIKIKRTGFISLFDQMNACTTGCRQLSSLKEQNDIRLWCQSSDGDTEHVITASFNLMQNFVTEGEEKSLLKEAESYLKKIRYEYDHWDDAIHGFRETEKSRWNDGNKAILHRIREAAFEPDASQMTLVHLLDLAKDGYIKPHIDSIKFCGQTITGLSLISSSIMKLVNEKHPEQWAKILLQPRSLYIMMGQSRYNYTHEILKQDESIFQGQVIPRDRRISIMCRNEPTPVKAS